MSPYPSGIAPRPSGDSRQQRPYGGVHWRTLDQMRMRAADLAARGQVVDYQRPAEKPITPIRRYRLIRPPSLRCADCATGRIASENSSTPTTTQATTYSPSTTAAHHIRTRSGSGSTASPQPLGSRGSRFDLRHSYATGTLKARVSPKVISERIGHANVGFFLETYAHVLKNDDRDAAKQAASFLVGDGWDS